MDIFKSSFSLWYQSNILMCLQVTFTVSFNYCMHPRQMLWQQYEACKITYGKYGGIYLNRFFPFSVIVIATCKYRQDISLNVKTDAILPHSQISRLDLNHALSDLKKNRHYFRDINLDPFTHWACNYDATWLIQVFSAQVVRQVEVGFFKNSFIDLQTMALYLLQNKRCCYQYLCHSGSTVTSSYDPL